MIARYIELGGKRQTSRREEADERGGKKSKGTPKVRMGRGEKSFEGN